MNSINEKIDKFKFLIKGYDKFKFSSSKYWQSRYNDGGNSGAGSYGRLAEFKAEVINDFVVKNSINTVIEFGCGDGNQLSMMNFNNYLGFDVSSKAIEICKNKFINDKNKDFIFYDPNYFSNNSRFIKAELVLSLDVIFHLIEDNVFESYMKNLFNASQKYIIIYSTNTDDLNDISIHVKHRKFTNWIEKNISGFKLTEHIPNKYPIKDDKYNESFADFYIFENIDI